LLPKRKNKYERRAKIDFPLLDKSDYKRRLEKERERERERERQLFPAVFKGKESLMKIFGTSLGVNVINIWQLVKKSLFSMVASVIACHTRAKRSSPTMKGQKS
jgi:uncharacterized membrane protein